MVADHEPRDGMVQVRLGAEAESNYNCSIWLEGVDFRACRIVNRDTEDLRASIAEAMIDVWDVILNLLRCVVEVFMDSGVVGEILGVLLYHRRKIFSYNEIRWADGTNAAVVEPQRP